MKTSFVRTGVSTHDVPEKPIRILETYTFTLDYGITVQDVQHKDEIAKRIKEMLEQFNNEE